MRLAWAIKVNKYKVQIRYSIKCNLHAMSEQSNNLVITLILNNSARLVFYLFIQEQNSNCLIQCCILRIVSKSFFTSKATILTQADFKSWRQLLLDSSKKVHFRLLHTKVKFAFCVFDCDSRVVLWLCKIMFYRLL